MVQRLETDAIRDKKDNRPLLHQKRRHRLLERYPQKSSGPRGESPSGTGRRIPCRNFLGGKCTYPSCTFWHPPVCLNYKSESGCTYGEKCRFRHVEPDGQPSKKSKKSGVKGSVALIKGVFTIGLCVSRENLYGEKEHWDQISPSYSPRARGTTSKIRERKGPSRGVNSQV